MKSEVMQCCILLLVVLLGIFRSARAANQYHFISKGRSYSEAQQYCRSVHTDLATVNSAADMQNLLATVSGGYSGAAWIGLYRQSTPLWHWSLTDHQYYTHGGTQYRNWQPGEPNNSGGIENCGSMGDNGKFSDTPCTIKKPFICFNAQTDQKYVLIEMPMTWKEAQSFCRLNHNDLVSVTNPEENLEIQKLTIPSERHFIGLFKDNFTWSDGSTYAFRYWAAGHPAAGNVSDCCVGLWVLKGPWVCGKCSLAIPFFCYTEKRKQILKVEVQTDDDVNDPVVKEAILEKLWTVVKENNMAHKTNLSWIVRPDGNIFHKKKTSMDPTKCD